MPTSTDSDGSIASRLWNFGNGAISAAQNPLHTFAAAGSYTVTLTVTDNGGASAGTSKTVTVAANVPPAAAYTYSCTRLNCKFTDTSTDTDGSIASRLWNFGDGSTSTARNPSHKFSTSGTYTVMLTVIDNGGANGSTSKTVTVSR